MVAARVAWGTKYSAGVSSSAAARMPTAVNTPAAGVCAPASKFTTERAKPPVTGKPPVKAAPRLPAPRATSSRSGSMRWRRRAARVWPTDTDSTKPTTLISSAGRASACHSARSHSGAVSGGRPCGTVPTILTPCCAHCNCQVSAADIAMPTTGAAFAAKSAPRAGKPRRTSSGLRPRRAQNRKATIVRPSAAVSTCTSPAWRTSPPTSSKKCAPSTFTPSSTFNCPAAISKAEAVMKPEITGWLRKCARKPQRSSPITSSMAPERKASVKAMAA